MAFMFHVSVLMDTDVHAMEYIVLNRFQITSLDVVDRITYQIICLKLI